MKRLISRLAPALLGMILAAPALAHTLQGRVLEQASLTPIPDAEVFVHVIDPDSLQFSTTSDQAGNYVFAALPPGNSIYVVTCFKSGYQSSYARVDELATGDMTYDILLGQPDPPPQPGEPPPDSGSVSGLVMAPDEGGTLHPVTGATVTLESAAGTAIAVTDALGAYETWVGLGTCTVAVTASGHDPLSGAGLSVVAGGVRFDAVLHPTGRTDVPDPSPATRVRLGSAIPNPARAGIALSYWLPAPGHVELALFDTAGRRARTVVSGWENAGPRSVRFSVQGLPSGTYFCRLRVGGETATRVLQVMH